MGCGQRHDRVHIGALPVEMHRHDGARGQSGKAVRPVGQQMLNRRRIDIKGDRIDIHEDRRGPDAIDRADRGKEGVGCGDNRVARPDTERHQRDDQGIRSGGDAHGRLGPAVGGCLGLERSHFGSQDEILSVAYLVDSGPNFIAQRGVLRLQVK